MSTVEDFKNAPVGSTATSPDGRQVYRREAGTLVSADWVRGEGDGRLWADADGLARYGYTLDPVPSPAPTTVQEALDLAWELAYPVKEGQTIPSGTRYVLRAQDGGLPTYTDFLDWTPTFPENVRTLDPLPDPEPDWLDARAVLADCDCNAGERTVHVNYSEIAWTCTDCDNPIAPEDMKNVTPLYPKETTK